MSDHLKAAYISAAGAAAYLGVAEHTLANWRWKGAGPRFTKLNRAIRYRIADLDAYAEAGMRASTREAA